MHIYTLFLNPAKYNNGQSIIRLAKTKNQKRYRYVLQDKCKFTV